MELSDAVIRDMGVLRDTTFIGRYTPAIETRSMLTRTLITILPPNTIETPYALYAKRANKYDNNAEGINIITPISIISKTAVEISLFRFAPKVMYIPYINFWLFNLTEYSAAIASTEIRHIAIMSNSGGDSDIIFEESLYSYSGEIATETSSELPTMGLT